MAQNSKQQAWYRLNTATPKSDSQVSDVLIQQKGQVIDYQVKGISLKSLNHKSVSEVITQAKNNEQQAFDQALSSQRNNYRGELATDKSNQRMLTVYL